jgi:hypothetical protein
MNAPDLLALRPLALGHDQEASACHWAQLTHRTTDYPSRRAQLALALAAGAVPATPDVAALLYRCDDCSRCRAQSSLPQLPDLARALWPLRAWLVEQGVVPEVEALRLRLLRQQHLLGDLAEAWQRLGPGVAGAPTVLVPDGAVLACDLPAARAALKAAACVCGPLALLREVPDSGRVLREVGLAAEADRFEAEARQRVADGGFRRVLAGTPKEAAALADVLRGLAVEVQYVGSALARAALEGRVRFRPAGAEARQIVLHPSAALLADPSAYSLIVEWLGAWLGNAFRPEPDPVHTAWPAAVERPAIGLPVDLARQLARRRLDQLLACHSKLILTCDPYSQRALRAVAPGEIEVVDLLVYAMQHKREPD